LTRVCEESENMMNRTLVEDRLDGSSNFSSWKSRLQVTLEEEDLLWVIQKGLPETATDEEKEERKEDDVKARKIIINSSSYIEGSALKYQDDKRWHSCYLLHEDVRDHRSTRCHWKNHISTLRYALVFIICIIVMRVLAGGRNLCCNRGSRGISMHSEE
jgi:hypothetical protein